MFAEPFLKGAFKPVLDVANRSSLRVKDKISSRDQRSAVAKTELLRHFTQIGHEEPPARTKNDTVQQSHISHRCDVQ